MPEILDDVVYLSQEIGPRPSGTEEEQQAALYLTERFQKGAGLSASIEDFTCAANGDLARFVCFGVALAALVLSSVFSMIALAGLALSLVVALVFLFELKGTPTLSRLLARSASQNVVARYVPEGVEGKAKRARKIVVVSHYDSGKVMLEMRGPFVAAAPLVSRLCLVSLFAAPVIILLHGVVLSSATGAPALILVVLMVLDAVLLAVPLILFIIHKVAPFNEAANCNASGAAVLVELARRVSSEPVVQEDVGSDGQSAPVVHGEDAARSSFAVSEDVPLEYEVEPNVGPRIASPGMQEHVVESAPDDSELGRLASAKAAVAAMTGQPVGSIDPDVVDRLARPDAPQVPAMPRSDDEVRAFRDATRDALTGKAEEAEQGSEAPVPQGEQSSQRQDQSDLSDDFEVAFYRPVPSLGADSDSAVVEAAAAPDVPDWYRKAQEKVKRTESPSSPHIQKSRFASALDQAVKQSSVHFDEANQKVNEELASRLEMMKEGIREVKAPGFESSEEQASAGPQKDILSDDVQASHIPADDGRSFAKGDAAKASPADEIPAESVAAAPVASMPPYENPVAAARKAEPLSGVEMPQLPADFEMPERVEKKPQILADADSEKAGHELGSTTSIAPIDVSSLRNAASREEGFSPIYQAPAQESSADESTQPLKAIKGRLTGKKRVADAESMARAIQPNVVLPEISEMGDDEPSAKGEDAIDSVKQRAPLAQATEEDGKAAAKSLLHMVPKVTADDFAKEDAASEPVYEPASAKRDLKASLPSMSGTITAQKNGESDNAAVSATGSFAAVSATGKIAPVGDELVADIAPDEVYISDADDSSFEDNYTETGAFAGPDYMDMPSSRAGRFFKKFGRKKSKQKEQYGSPQQWLDVDDDFDARSVGKERGGWESFQDDSTEYENPQKAAASAGYTEFGGAAARDEVPEGKDANPDNDWDDGWNKGTWDDDRPWKGGAFSLRRVADRFTSPSAEGQDDASVDEVPQASRMRGARREASAADGGRAAEVRFSQPYREDDDRGDDLRRIHGFHASDINAEVWFVALGSEMADNAGFKAFMEAHRKELHGAIVIDLEALGAGDLCCLSAEGVLRRTSPSSRVKRFVKRAEQATGRKVSEAPLSWKESPASIFMSRGGQALSLVGMQGAIPAYYAQGDDVVENVDPATLEDNTAFVLELLKNI